MSADTAEPTVRSLVLDAVEILQDATDSGPPTVEELLADIAAAKQVLRAVLELLA